MWSLRVISTHFRSGKKYKIADKFTIWILTSGDHNQRGGLPTAYDRLLASRMGVKAVEALMEGKHGVMTGLQGKNIEFIPLLDVISNKRQVNMEYYHMTKVLAR